MNSLFPSYFEWFCRGIFWSYDFILILLAGYLFLRPGRNWEAINFLFVVNTLTIIATAISFVELGYYLYETYYVASRYEWFSFSGPFDERFYYTAIIIIHIAGLLFLFKKLRQSMLFSLCFLVLTHWQYVYLMILKWFPGRVPSSWSVYINYDRFERLIYFLVFIFSVGLMYFILYLRNKLPYKSSLLERREV